MEKLAYLLIFLLLVAAEILLLPKKKEDLNFSFSGTAATAKRQKIGGLDNLSKWERFKLRTIALLKKMGKTWEFFLILSFCCFVCGLIVGFICFNGFFLSFVTAVCFIPLSYLYVLFKTQASVRDELAELQNAMSVITNAYLASNDLLGAVESYVTDRKKFLSQEEIALLKTSPFEEFVTECIMFNPNMDTNLEGLAAKINNKYFDQWVKNLRLCLENKDMRFSLQPVIRQMADEKLLQIESDSIMRKTWVNYFTMVGLMFAIILICRIARREWYLILVTTPLGKAIILLMLVTAIISALYVIRLNKPLSNL